MVFETLYEIIMASVEERNRAATVSWIKYYLVAKLKEPTKLKREHRQNKLHYKGKNKNNICSMQKTNIINELKGH